MEVNKQFNIIAHVTDWSHLSFGYWNSRHHVVYHQPNVVTVWTAAVSPSHLSSISFSLLLVSFWLVLNLVLTPFIAVNNNNNHLFCLVHKISYSTWYDRYTIWCDWYTAWYDRTCHSGGTLVPLLLVRCVLVSSLFASTPACSFSFHSSCYNHSVMTSFTSRAVTSRLHE